MLEIRGQVKQGDAAALVGLTQSRISRAERGTYTLDPDVADAYAMALGASPAQRKELVALCKAAVSNTVTGQARLIRRGAAIQEKTRDLEAQSSIVRTWQPEIVPGLLQTWDYTLAVIEREPDAKWSRARRERLALLDEPDRHFHQLLSEATLRWVIGGPLVMAEQLRHLSDVSTRPNMTLGIVPFGRAAPAPPSAGHLSGGRVPQTCTDVGTSAPTSRCTGRCSTGSTRSRSTGTRRGRCSTRSPGPTARPELAALIAAPRGPEEPASGSPTNTRLVTPGSPARARPGRRRLAGGLR